LYEGEGKLVYDYGMGEGIRDGWLAPLTIKGHLLGQIAGVGRKMAGGGLLPPPPGSTRFLARFTRRA